MSLVVRVLVMLCVLAIGARARAEAPVAAQTGRTLLCDTSTDAAHRRELVARHRLGDRSGAYRVLRRVAVLRPDCSLVGLLMESMEMGLDPGLVLELSEPAIDRLGASRASLDESNLVGHALGIAGAVLGVAALLTTSLGANASSCDHVAFGASCDSTPRTVLLASGVLAGAVAIALTTLAIVVRVELGRARHRWAVEGFAL